MCMPGTYLDFIRLDSDNLSFSLCALRAERCTKLPMTVLIVAATHQQQYVTGYPAQHKQALVQHSLSSPEHQTHNFRKL